MSERSDNYPLNLLKVGSKVSTDDDFKIFSVKKSPPAIETPQENADSIREVVVSGKETNLNGVAKVASANYRAGQHARWKEEGAKAPETEGDHKG